MGITDYLFIAVSAAVNIVLLIISTPFFVISVFIVHLLYLTHHLTIPLNHLIVNLMFFLTSTQ